MRKQFARFWNTQWIKMALRLIIPLTLAFALLQMEPLFTWLARERPGILPVSMFALIGGLLVSRIRRWLIVILCYGICLLAMKDSFKVPLIPALIDYQFIETLYPFIWLFLAALAATAGSVEALSPGSVWARRSYFAAAGVYFSGHGLLSLLSYPNWEGLVMLATGIVAFIGVFLAQRIVASEIAAMPEDEDIRALAQMAEKRARHLQSKEWRENH
jgi:low affinity Fe/Cu permease